MRISEKSLSLECAILVNLFHRLICGNSGHAASAVSGRAGLIEAWDRRAKIRISRRRAHVEELFGRQFTVEDISPDHSKLLFHVIGTYDLAIKDCRLEVRGKIVVGVDHPVRIGFQFVAVRRGGPLVRNPLGEQRHDVGAPRRQGFIPDRRDGSFGEWMF